LSREGDRTLSHLSQDMNLPNQQFLPVTLKVLFSQGSGWSSHHCCSQTVVDLT